MLTKARVDERSSPASKVTPLKRAQFAKTQFSKSWTFFDGDWREGNAAIMGARTHATWLGSMVFDGARAFEGVVPDLDLHCARVNRSAESFALQSSVSVEEWIAL